MFGAKDTAIIMPESPVDDNRTSLSLGEKAVCRIVYCGPRPRVLLLPVALELWLYVQKTQSMHKKRWVDYTRAAVSCCLIQLNWFKCNLSRWKYEEVSLSTLVFLFFFCILRCIFWDCHHYPIFTAHWVIEPSVQLVHLGHLVYTRSSSAAH